MRRTGPFRLLAALLAAACVRAAAPEPGAAAVRAGGVGVPWKPVSFAILEDYDLGTDLTEPARDFALFRRLGVTTWRGSISWLQVEPARGRRDFTWLHRFAQLAADSGITLRPYVAYTPAWAARGGHDADAWNDPPRSLADWSAFVRALAAELAHHSNVRSLEIYNEENTAQWWDGTASSYDSVLAAAASSVREVAPRLQLLLGGMVWPDVSWTERACEAAHVDVVPFHSYAETWTPDSVTVESYLHDFGYDAFLPAERAACARAPVWINETGFATTHGRTERDQALWWARAVPTFLAQPGIEHVGVYEIKDLRPTRDAIGGAENYHLGITDTLRRPKQAFDAVRLLVRLFGVDSIAVLDSALDVRVTDAPAARYGPFVHAFLRPDGRQIVAVWTRRGSPSVTVRLARSGRRAIDYDLAGHGRPIARFDGVTLPAMRLTPEDVRIVEILP